MAKVSAESTPKDPEIANLKYAVFQCKEGFAAKDSRAVFKIVSEKCIEQGSLICIPEKNRQRRRFFLNAKLSIDWPII